MVQIYLTHDTTEHLQSFWNRTPLEGLEGIIYIADVHDLDIRKDFLSHFIE